jgi:hypothetical protein
MIYFIQAIEYDMNMHAKIQCMKMHEFLQTNPSNFAFLEIYKNALW